MQSIIKKEFSEHIKTSKATMELIATTIETASKLCIESFKK